MKSLTLEQAKKLKIGDTLYHLQNQNAEDCPQRWRVNGKVKTWKRHPEKVQVPIKNGLRNCDYLTEKELSIVSLTPYWQKRFTWMSESNSFQRKKRKEGFRTHKEVHAGIGTPYTLIKWERKSI